MHSLSTFDSVAKAFAIDGETMRLHRGRSVVRVHVDDRPCYLKRFWWTPAQTFRRFVAQGLHELVMIDWLESHGFSGPDVIARGLERRAGFKRRMFFLMREVEGEVPLERYFRRHRESTDDLVSALAAHTARLHDAGFYHLDYSERHLLVSESNGGIRFRQIDLERARVGPCDEKRATADIKTLICSIADEDLAAQVEGAMVDRYVACRSAVSSIESFRKLLDAAIPTKTFE